MLTLDDILELNLSPKNRKEIHGAMCQLCHVMERAVCHVSSFTCITMSVVWYRIPVPIDFCSNDIQVSDATLDMEDANVESLLAQLVARRDSWKAVWNEAKQVASSLQVDVILSSKRSMPDENVNDRSR